MRYLSISFLLIIFISCNQRKTKNDALKESITKFKDSIKPIEIVEYVPREYSETITDTTIYKGINIIIKTYTDMSDNVINEVNIDSTNYKHFYREIKSDLTIKLDGKIIFNDTIDKSYFKKGDNDSFFWKEALMLGLYLDEYKTTDKQFCFNVSYCMIESEICNDYYLIIDNKGVLEIKDITTNEIH